LGYIPYPFFEDKGIQQHNPDGYRGQRVPLEKTDKFRLLCLGGSTTYGWGVDSPTQAFPARLEVLLNNYITNDTLLSNVYSGAEVINAGLNAATSAEELQQYLFKYRYYRPDAVLVHSGINDAEVVNSTTANFQLDYTHYRRINFHLEPLQAPARWLMHSHLMSYAIITLFYRDFSIAQNEFAHQSAATICAWNTLPIDTIIAQQNLRYYPFFQNRQSLFREIRNDSASLVLLPNLLNENDAHVRSATRYRQLTALHNTLSDSLCRQHGGTPVAFTFESIKIPARWIDDCHLDATGEQQKAQLLLPYFISLMQQNASKK
jgi:lysophospholipase L1-like esterase